MDFVPGGDALHRPELGRRIAGIAHDEGLHRFGEGPLEPRPHRLDDDEPLAGDAALPAVDHPRGGADLGGGCDVGVLQHNVGVRTTQLEDALLQGAARRARDRLARPHAAGEGDRGDGRGFDHRAHVAAGDQQGAEHVLGKARLAEDALNGQGAAGDIAGVFEHRRIARHQGGGGEAEHLPEGEIPRHHRQDHPQGIEGHKRLGAAQVHRPPGQIGLGVVGEMIAAHGALFDLGQALGEGLAHLGGHQGGELVLAAAQHRGGGLHQPGALGEGGAPPGLERVVGGVGEGQSLAGGMALEHPTGHAGRRISRGKARALGR